MTRVFYWMYTFHVPLTERRGLMISGEYYFVARISACRLVIVTNIVVVLFTFSMEMLQ